MKLSSVLATVLFGCLVPGVSFAAGYTGGGGGGGNFGLGGGTWSLGLDLGFVNADQSDLNTLRDRANTRSSISTHTMGNAWEGAGFISYRFQGSSVAFLFRPTYFFQSVEGSGTGGSYDYSVTGYTVFPTLRFHMLENQMIKFFSQVGIGVGFVDGAIKEGTASVDFSGTGMGYFAGLGAEFCFFAPNHCFTIEGNFRYLAFSRVLADKVSGDFSDGSHAGPPASLSQAAKGKEVEIDQRDLSISLSGVLMLLGYTMYF